MAVAQRVSAAVPGVSYAGRPATADGSEMVVRIPAAEVSTDSLAEKTRYKVPGH